MRESEEIECAFFPSRISIVWRLEGNQARLRRMNGQPELPEPFWQHRHQGLSILFTIAADDKVIAVTNEENPSLHTGFGNFGKPFIQNMMEKDIRQ
jgi:hypothetical protein